jgi:hypothetical protein
MLFGCRQIVGNSNHLLESGLLKPHQLLSLKDLEEDLLRRLSTDVMAYVDALGDIDLIQRTLIGTDRPDMYQRMYQQAEQHNTMNKHRF